MILQAAGWLPLLRRDLARFFGTWQGPGVDVLGDRANLEGELPSFSEIFEHPSPDAGHLRLDGEPGAAAPLAITVWPSTVTSSATSKVSCSSTLAVAELRVASTRSLTSVHHGLSLRAAAERHQGQGGKGAQKDHQGDRDVGS